MGRYDDNANAQNGDAVAVAHTIHGSPVAGALMPQKIGAEGGGVQLLHQAHISDYKPPPRRHRDNPDRALCSEDGCNAYPMSGKDYCTGHARHHGQTVTCAKRECNSYPKGDTLYCRWHQPAEKVTSGDTQ